MQVCLLIYNVHGQVVRVLLDEERSPGSLKWDGRNEGGVPVPSGVYFYSLTAGRDFFKATNMGKMKVLITLE